MSGNKLLGGCAKGPQWTYDEAGNICVTIPNCVTGEDLKIPPIPEDMFTTCEISEDGRSVSLNIPGKEAPVVLKLNAIDRVVSVAEDGTETPVEIEDCTLKLPEPQQICWGLNEDGCPVIGIPNCITGEELVIDAVQGVTGNVVDNTDPKNPVITAVASVSGEGVDNTDPQNPIISGGTAVTDPATGTTTQTNPDGTQLVSCDSPVKGITGDGVDNTDPQNPIIASSTTVPNADGSIHTITTDDGVATELCTDPVKSLVDNGDNTWTATTQSGVETVVRDTFGTLVDNGDGTATITMPDGQTKQIVCAPLPADIRVTAISVVPTANADGSTSYNIELTLSDGSTLNGGPVVDTNLFASVVPDNGDGTGTVTDAAGNALTVCTNPAKDIRLNADGSSTVVLADGTDGETIPASPDEWSESIVVDTTADPVVYPAAPTVAATCSKMLDADGNFIGTVDDAGPHPIPECVKDGYAVNGPTGTGDVDSAGNTIVYIDQNGDPLPDGVNAVHMYGPEGEYLSSYYSAPGAELTHTDATVVPNDCVQPSLRDQNGNPLAKGACVAPAEIMTCVQLPATAFVRMRPTQTGEHSVIFTDPVTKASVAMYIDVEGPGVINLEAFLAERFSFASALGPNNEVEVNYSIRYTWLGTEIYTPDCPTTYDWLTTTGDYDETAAGNNQNNIQPAIFTPLVGPALVVTGAATETPAGSGTYVVDAGAGAGADAAWFLTTLNPVAGDQHGSDDQIWSRDAIGGNTRVRYREGVKVYRDCDGNFIRAVSALTGLPVLEADLP